MIADLPDDDPVHAEMTPLMLQIDDLARAINRCRIINRAFGCALSPDQAARALPDEAVDLLLALDDHSMIDDSLTALRLLQRK